jgi:hypothetical protein
MSVEIEPYVVYRFVGSNVEVALLPLTEGERALALFHTADAAHTYRKATNLGDEWLLLHPTKKALLELLRAIVQAGVRYAVLDPDGQRGKSIFDLAAVLKAAEAADLH